MRIREIERRGHERVIRAEAPAAGLQAYIAIHSTRRGPAVGGVRMRPYAGEAEALEDALRLSRSMTYKTAAADLPLGGGKAVILGDPARDKTPALLAAFGEAVEALEGRYWTAEDMGLGPADMEAVARTTAHVAGRVEGRWASGDPSPVTARGIFGAMQVAARHRFGDADLAGRTVAQQGLGHVGMALAERLAAAGARLIVADVDPERARRAVARFGAEAVAPEAIHAAPAEIFAPCATGGVLNAWTIPEIAASVVAGGANTQLATAEDGTRLRARGILYAPDYIVNAGGVVNVATEILRIGDRARFVDEKLASLARAIDAILFRAVREGKSPEQVADATVEAAMLDPAA